MASSLSLTVSMDFNTSLSKVWDAIVNPKIIKQYLFGTETVSDWKVGSSIIFQGVWEGVTYKDKGTILELIPEKKLKYDYWSYFSNLEDKSENYLQITFELSIKADNTILTLTQDNAPNQAAKEHSEANWKLILEQMKKIVENK